MSINSLKNRYTRLKKVFICRKEKNVNTMNKEKEAISFLNETRFELLKKLVNRIINGYATKWKKDKGNNFVKINPKNCVIGKKFSKILPKNERYILSCLESHWSRIEKKLESSDWDYQPNIELNKLFEVVRKIEKDLSTSGNIESEPDEDSLSNELIADETYPEIQNDFYLSEEDFELNLKLNDSEAFCVSNSLCCNSNVLNSLRNFYIFVNCEMNDEKLTKQLNSICSVDFLFHNKNLPQMNKMKPLSLDLTPLNENQSNSKIIDKSFKDLDNVDTLNITSPTAIPLHNNQICYINFSKVWKESRWSAVKQRLIQRGVMESNGMYVVFPIYRKEFIIGKGSFGVVEFGLSRTYHGIALKRLTENGFCINRYEDIQSTLHRFSDLTCENLHKTIAFQDMAGYAFLSSRICEYNLSEYIAHVKNNMDEWNGERKLSIFQQIIKGLMALHMNTPIIVHGNLKPSNILIDENGVVKLAEFGLFMFLYDNESQVNEADKIWRPKEVDSLQKNCNSMSDIFSLGLLAVFIYSNGIVPTDGSKYIEILKIEFQGTNVELVQLVQQILHNDPVQRPTVSEINKHIFFWSKERKWRFLLACIATISYESSIEYSVRQQYSLSNYLETVWHHQNVKTYWISQVFMNFPCTAISKGARHDSPIDLLKFLVKSREEYPYLFCEPSVVLETYPDLPFLIYSALKFKEQTSWETFHNLRSFLV